jgi:putative DNA primase/helicase
MKNNVLDLAKDRWVEILSTVGGIPVHYLDNKHKPCPSCRDGRDRFRFDDLNGTGSWYCSHCGGRDGSGGGGNGMDLLMRCRGWDFKQAAQTVSDYLGIPTKQMSKSSAQAPTKPPTDAPAPAMDGAACQWCYTNSDGEQLFWIQRVNKADGSKLFRHKTWIEGQGWQGATGTSWPTPRPLYNVAALARNPEARVIVCEGEKAANFARQLFPSVVVVAWPNGAQSVSKVDWSPLAGRQILLWPDNDDEGRKAMAKAASLIPNPAKLLTIDPPPGAPEKWDIADSGWTKAEAHAFVKQNAKPFTAPEPEPEPEQPDSTSALPFKPLGFDHGIFYYLPVAARQVVSLTAAQHNQSHFLMLAPLQWWLDGFGDEKGRVDWASAQNAVMGACIAQGVYDPSRVRGRGAWADANRVILHLGNRLVIDGRSRPITELPADFQTYYFYENAKAIDGPGEDTLPDDTAAKLRAIAERFRWETPASANLLLGWIVLAPVCGALNWRPHIWITGGAGTGKTTILRDFMKPMLGGMFEGATGGTTEAGLRGQLRSDAIPVVFDELEQNEQKDKQVVQNILALARIASSEGGKIYKGTTNGGSNTFEIRSMFCVSSINVALVQRADLDRFCVLPLRKDYMDKNDWIEFEKQILEVCTEENGRQLVSRTLKQIPVIRKNAKSLASALSKRFGQRFGDQYGTLLAGAWTLEADGGGELTTEEAHEWIEGMSWEANEIDSTDADEMKCLNQVLQSLIAVEGGKRMTILELVQLARGGVMYLKNSRLESTEEIESLLGRYGVKVFETGMAIANNSTNLQALLKDTPWAGNAYRQSLRRISGAIASGSSIRFKGTGVARATLVPWESIETADRG